MRVNEGTSFVILFIDKIFETARPIDRGIAASVTSVIIFVWVLPL